MIYKVYFSLSYLAIDNLLKKRKRMERKQTTESIEKKIKIQENGKKTHGYQN